MTAPTIQTETYDKRATINLLKGAASGALLVPFGAVALPMVLTATVSSLAKEALYQGLESCGVTTDLETSKPVVDKSKRPHLHRAIDLVDKAFDLPEKATTFVLGSSGKLYNHFLKGEGASYNAALYTGAVASIATCFGPAMSLAQRL